MITIAIIPDVHRPFHDTRAYDLVLGIFQDIGIDQLILSGDYADFHDLSQHGPKDPRITELLREEIQDVREGLWELDVMFPDIPKVYIEGNHEFRLHRFIQNKARELFDIIDLPSILKMSDYGFEYVEYGPHQSYMLTPNLCVRHEPLKSSGPASIKTALDCSIISGHNHKQVVAKAKSFLGNEYYAISGGHLLDVTQHVFNYMKARCDWHMGATVITIEEDQSWHHEPTRINDDYSCYFRGRTYKA